jgi:hypothetical protein
MYLLHFKTVKYCCVYDLCIVLRESQRLQGAHDYDAKKDVEINTNVSVNESVKYFCVCDLCLVLENTVQYKVFRL